jgi:RHS repeat-associated protein
MPSGVQPGDLLLAFVGETNTLACSAFAPAENAGLTLDANGNPAQHAAMVIGYRIATGTEAPTYTCGTNISDVTIVAYRGVDPSTPFDYTSPYALENFTSPAAYTQFPKVAAVTSGAAIVHFVDFSALHFDGHVPVGDVSRVAGDSDEQSQLFVSDLGVFNPNAPDNPLPAATYPTPAKFWLHESGDGALATQALVLHASGAPLATNALSILRSLGGSNPGAKYACACQRRGGDPVDPATGNFYETFTDLTIPGRGLGLGFSHTYNSYPNMSVPDGPLGYGWSFDYGQKLTRSGANVTITQENGSTLDFTLVGNVYIAPREITSTLTDNGDGTFDLVRTNKLETFTFDATTGDLLSIRTLNNDPATNHYKTTLAYDGLNRLASETDASGRTLAFGYDASNRITSVTDPTGRAVQFAYDAPCATDELCSVTEPDGAHWSFSYDANHRMTSLLDPDQNGSPAPHPLTNSYDPQGRVTNQTDPLGRITNFNYTALANAGGVIVTDPKGNQTADYYTSNVLTSETRGYGSLNPATTLYTYDPLGSLGIASITDPLQHTTRATYDVNDNEVTATDALNRTTTTTYNTLAEPLSSTDPTQITTSYSYDPAGNLLSTSRPCVMPDHTSCGPDTTVAHYDDPAHPGDVTRVTDPNGKVSSFSYDTYGDQITATDATAKEAQSCFDTVGRETAAIAPAGTAAGVVCQTPMPGALPNTTYFTYDAMNAVLATTGPAPSGATTRTYDANHNLKTITDPNLNLTRYGYDLAGEQTSITRADMSVINDDYWPDGSLHHQYDASNHVTTYAYDPLGRVISVSDPLGRTTSYSYDLAGNLRTRQTQGGDCGASPPTGCTTYSYDAANELSAVNYSDGTTPDVSNITYDPDGERIAMTDGTGQPTWSYDSLHRIVSTTDGSGTPMSYGYDLAGNLTRITYPGGHVVTRGYDDAGRLQTVADWLGHQTTFNYNADSAITSEVYPNGTTATFTPDGADRLGGISDAPTNNPTAPFATFGYGRDSNDQVNSTNPTGVGQATQTYAYTALNQLKSVNGANYTFDASDNITGMPSGTKLAYDNANELCWTAITSGACASRPTGATTYSYDQLGERTQMTPPSGVGTSYGYDQAGRLTQANISNQTTDTGQYHTLTQTRILDTRSTNNIGTCTPSPCARIAANHVLTVNVAGQGGIPTTGVSAVVLNVTAFSPSASSNLVVYPSDATRPSTRDLSLNPGQPISNTVIAKLDTTGQLDVSSVGADTDVAFDVEGYFSAPTGTQGGTYNPITPQRIADSRDATHTSNCGPSGTTACNNVIAGGSITVTIAGLDPLPPASEVSAVALNITATNTTAAGFVTAYPAGTTRPSVRSLSFDNADTVTELVVAKLSSDGKITLYFGSGGGDFMIDVDGYYSATTTDNSDVYVPQVDTRSVDTRSGTRTGSCTPSCSTLTAGGSITIQMTGHANVPTSGVGAVSVEVTAINPTAAGYLTVHYLGAAGLRTVSFASGEAVTDASIVALPPQANGQIVITSSVATDVLVDVNGWYIPATNTWNYQYDGDGNRATKIAPDGTTTHFTWDTAEGPSLLASDGINQYIYGPGGIPIEQVTGNTVVYYHQDQQGTTRALTDQSGNVIATYSYDPYGNLTASTGTTTTPLGYDGQYQDNETGLIYLRARYYDPATAQFITRDPAVALTGDAYGYAEQNPLNTSDPTGLWPWDGKKFDLGRAIRGLADFGAGIGNFFLSTVTLGHLHIAAPYCDVVSWSYKLGELYAGGSTAAFIGYGAYRAAPAALALLASQNGNGDTDALAASGSSPDPADVGGQLTRAGRAFAKAIELFGPTSGGPSAINAAGQNALNAILTNPGTIQNTMSGGIFAGGKVFISPNGTAAVFGPDGTFQYFGRMSYP